MGGGLSSISRGEVGSGGSCVSCVGLVGGGKCVSISVVSVVASVGLVSVR